MTPDNQFILSEKDRDEWKAGLEHADARKAFRAPVPMLIPELSVQVSEPVSTCFEGITIPEGFRFEGIFAYKVKKVKSTDIFGNKVTREELTPIGNWCIIIAKLRIDNGEGAGLRLQCMDAGNTVKEFDIRIGEEKNIITLARKHGFHVSNAYQFRKMLDEMFYANFDTLPIIEVSQCNSV